MQAEIVTYSSEMNREKSTLGKILEIMPLEQRNEAVWLFFLMGVVAIFETVGVGVILPFVSIASDPATLHRKGMLSSLYVWSGAATDRQFLVLSGALVLVLLVSGNALRAFSTWRMHRFSQLAGHALAMKLISSYLSRPYEYFLTRHTADLGKNILQEVHQVVNGMIFVAVSGFSRFVSALLLTVLLFVAEPFVACFVILFLGGAYAAMYAMSRKLQSRLGSDHVAANHGRYYLASEIFAAIKDVKFKRLENVSTERFSAPSVAFARGLALSMTLSQIPRFFLEAFAFSGILMIVLYLLIARGGIAEALPLVSLYAFAGYRLLPALQEIFNAATRLRFSRSSLDLIYRELSASPTHLTANQAVSPLPFAHSIRLEGVCYRYPLGDRPVLNDVTFEIPHGARVGLIGPTGSGKSTLIDVVLGLLRPTMGRIVVDGTPLTDEETIRRWQVQIGYVPQHIFLADDTVAANIAFGQARGDVDRAEVEQAARMAQLHEFIVNELVEGYETQIGERGVRLSGGQRQRLALARALYGHPTVLVLDEATSALDNETEAMVVEALDAIEGEVTIITVAHRLSTIRHSDLVVRVEGGRVVASGAAEEVLAAEGTKPARGLPDEHGSV